MPFGKKIEFDIPWGELLATVLMLGIIGGSISLLLWLIIADLNYQAEYISEKICVNEGVITSIDETVKHQGEYTRLIISLDDGTRHVVRPSEEIVVGNSYCVSEYTHKYHPEDVEEE